MCKHSVRFYDHTYPAREAGDFIAEGLLAEDTCVVMLSQPHRAAVEQRLNELGVRSSPDGARPARYTVMDTSEVLSHFMVGGRLDLEQSAEKLEQLMSRAGGGGTVRLVGDLAPVLFGAGREDDAIALEDLVDALALQHGASVFCAYPLQGFFRSRGTNSLFRMSARHASVAFPTGLWIDGFLNTTGPGKSAFQQAREASHSSAGCTVKHVLKARKHAQPVWKTP